MLAKRASGWKTDQSARYPVRRADKIARLQAMTNARVEGGLRRSIIRLALALCIALLGLVASYLLKANHPDLRPDRLAHSAAYGELTSALLTVGLFASAFGISRRELRRNARVVIVAVTLGVTAKAALTGGIMALAFGSIAYLMLGVAVAQIDPLSVAAMLRHSRMSERARSVLSAWASFDDPVTVLLVVYLAAFTLPHVHQAGALTATSASYLAQAAANAALVAAAAAAWYAVGARRAWRSSAGQTIVQCTILVLLLAAAVRFDLLIGITVCGLFFRPAIESVLSRAVDVAFYGATFLLGTLLLTATGVAAGLLLGVVAFGVQGLAGWAIGYRMTRADRVYLALGQQNGITAIILALALQPYIPSAVAIIAVAILVVNTLHITCNGIWDRRQARLASVPEPVLAANERDWHGRETPMPEGSHAGARAAR
jgi:NhaP-type Na+/H+ or K+/H+ antiporter